MRRPQFSPRTLLTVMIVVACFYAGIRLERWRQRREEESQFWADADRRWQSVAKDASELKTLRELTEQLRLKSGPLWPED